MLTRLSSVIGVRGRTPHEPVFESKQDPLSRNSDRRFKEDSLELVVHQLDDDSDASVEECEFNSCIRTLTVTKLTPSEDRAQLGVVRCILAQPKQVNGWRKSVIVQTCTKIENKSCEVIVDSGSCINVVASKLIITLGMKLVKHPNSYKVTLIVTSIEVQERC